MYLNVTSAGLSEEKFRLYLLNRLHPVGRGRAVFFESVGFSAGRWSVLASAILEYAKKNQVSESIPNEHGIKYIIDGKLESPDQRNPLIRSIWFVEKGTELARFVTAYPLPYLKELK